MIPIRQSRLSNFQANHRRARISPRTVWVVGILACAAEIIAFGRVANGQTPGAVASAALESDGARISRAIKNAHLRNQSLAAIADRTGKLRVGIASFYAENFAGRRMADGARMDPRASIAASKILPLGTTAKVTNLETGKSTVVTVADRGPYVDGRMVDLSPAAARKIGISAKQGLAKVAVAPITVPLPDGEILPGAAADPQLAQALLAKDREIEQVRDARGEW